MNLKQLQRDAYKLIGPPTSDDVVWCDMLACVSDAWRQYRAGWTVEEQGGFFLSLSELVIRIAAYLEHRKQELGCETVKPIGDPATLCRRLAEILSDYECTDWERWAEVVGHCVAFAKQHGVNLRDTVHLRIDTRVSRTTGR